MKGLGVNRNRLLSDSCDPSSSHHREALYPPKNAMSSSSTLPRSPCLLTPASMDRYGTLDPHLYPTNTPDCMLNNQLPNSSTFPGLHYNHYDPQDFSPPESLGGMASLGTSMSLGLQPGMGISSLRTPMITSGSATISHHISKSQIPQTLLEFDKNLPGARDGFSTLQFHRTTALANSKQRTDSPGKIRYMLNSVQKLFNKTQSMEGHQVKNANGRSSGSGGGSSSAEDGGKQSRRAKSKDRATKEPKRRPRSNMSGYWSSDDLDSSDVSSYHHTLGALGIHDGMHSPQQRYIHSGYNTISSSKSSGDMKFSTIARGEGLGGVGGLGSLSVSDQDYIKGGSWSALTMGQPPRQLLQQGAHTLDRSMLKSKSCQQDLSTNYLQVGRRHDWSSSLGRGGAMGRGIAMEIPCRRMRSGSYVKAMGDTADSDDSDLSPKPSPKSAARRQSYLRATQQSLSDQLPPRNCLPSLQELSSNPPLDQMHSLGGERLDSLGGTVSSGWDDDDLREAVSSLAHSRMGQLRGVGSGPYEDHSSEFTFRDSRPQSQDSPPDLPSELSPHLPPELPRPSCFRSRSHSYLRAIQAGCSQDEDSLSLESTSPPPTESSVRTYSTSTVSTCVSTCKRTAPPPVPPRTTSKPYISVTVQSSTESAQDTYLEREEGQRPDRKEGRRSEREAYREEGLRSEVTSQSSQAHSNSSDSLDSTHGNSLARSIRRLPQITAVTRETREPLIQRDTREAIVPNRSHTATETIDCDTKGAKASLTLTGAAKANTALTPEDPQEAPAPRRKLSSIGIQVDCLQESSDPSPPEDPPPLSRFQSIGVQVEDGWQSRSSSMTKQDTDSDTQEVPLPLYKPQSKPLDKKVMVSCGSQSVAQDSLDQEEPTPSTPPITRQILNRSTTRSSSDSFSESLDPALDSALEPNLDSGLDPALDPSCLPPPDPWLESGVSGGGGAALTQGGVSFSGGNLCRRDGQWFLKLLEAERGRMEGWCEQMEQETQHHQLSDEALGKVHSAVSSAQLLMAQKFLQFQALCEQNLDPLFSPRPSPQDLARFWDLLQVSIEDLSLKFDELYHLKSNEWQPLERKDLQERPAATLKKPVKGRSCLDREQSVDPPSSSRQEAHKRLVAAKKSTSFRQNSATESADSLEMYVPEAQTRL